MRDTCCTAGAPLDVERSLPARRLASTIAVAAALSVPAAATPAPGAPVAGRPSVVVVLTDDQRWDTLAAMPTVRRR